MIDYIPEKISNPEILDVTSAWNTIPKIIDDLLTRFNISRNVALEFGVERGFSTYVLANYFKRVIGVDPFDWILDDKVSRDYYDVLKLLRECNNIQLIQSRFEEFIKHDIFEMYDLIHIDIGYDTHAYDITYPAGEWAASHSNCILFHDTISFPEITTACEELAVKYNFEFYNYREDIGDAGLVCGLGILIKKRW